MKYEKLLVLASLSAIALLSTRFADGAKTYQYTGDVTDVGKETVTVRRGGEEVQFAKPKDFSQKVHIGDRITIFYAMDAKKVQSAAQAPGQVPSNDEDRLKQEPIKDDRAFYNAENQPQNQEQKKVE